jgi:transcriptional regulator with XRE-family HTH domain
MNRRLQQFLELEELTPARLADILHIQRSGISHILSGRNKPSYEFINNFLSKFPRINAEWLITGKGKPYKDLEQNSVPKDNFHEKSDNDNILFPLDIVDNEDINHKINENEVPQNPLFSHPSTAAQPNKNVKRIIIFFSDGSFQEFYPPK